MVLANHSEEPLSVDSQGAVVTVRVHNSRDAVVSSETLPLVASKQEREGPKPHCVIVQVSLETLIQATSPKIGSLRPHQKYSS